MAMQFGRPCLSGCGLLTRLYEGVCLQHQLTTIEWNELDVHIQESTNSRNVR